MGMEVLYMSLKKLKGSLVPYSRGWPAVSSQLLYSWVALTLQLKVELCETGNLFCWAPQDQLQLLALCCWKIVCPRCFEQIYVVYFLLDIRSRFWKGKPHHPFKMLFYLQFSLFSIFPIFFFLCDYLLCLETKLVFFQVWIGFVPFLSFFLWWIWAEGYYFGFVECCFCWWWWQEGLLDPLANLGQVWCVSAILQGVPQRCSEGNPCFGGEVSPLSWDCLQCVQALSCWISSEALCCSIFPVLTLGLPRKLFHSCTRGWFACKSASQYGSRTMLCSFLLDVDYC